MTESVAVSEIFASKGRSGKDGIITRMLQLQATVKRFQFDLYVNLEGQHMLTSSWSQKISLLEQIDESNCTKHG